MTNLNKQPEYNRASILNWLLGLAVALVAGAIAFVGWNFIDSLQRQEHKLKSLNTTAENSQLSVQKYDMVNKDDDTKIESGAMSPKVAVQNIIAKLEGSEILFGQGTAASDVRQYTRAVDLFTKVLAMIPEEATKKKVFSAGGDSCDVKKYTAYTYAQRAFAYLQLHKYEPALEDLNEAIKLRGDDAACYENRAKVYILLGKKDLAAADMKKAREIGESMKMDMQMP